MLKAGEWRGGWQICSSDFAAWNAKAWRKTVWEPHIYIHIMPTAVYLLFENRDNIGAQVFGEAYRHV